MKNLFKFLFIIAMAISNLFMEANNIQISNVSLEGQDFTDDYVFVEFDITWENSWRTSSIPANHDAAWIFVKYRLAGMEWHHMLLSQTGYFAPTGSMLQIVSDSTGAFLYRNTDGNGTVTWNDARFKWFYGDVGIADDALVEVRVYGIEMVYMVEESFYIGDDSATHCFHQGGDPDSPYYITSEGSITIANTVSTELWASGSIIAGNLTAAYPKGYHDFYLMKYEVSQEQYVEFLNTLTREQQNTRTGTDISGTSITNVYVMSNTSTISSRNGIMCDATLNASGPVDIYCNYTNDGNHNDADDGQNIPCNYIHWMDAAAYLDWSCLRPMTELEFEKACRGPNMTVQGEYVWGNTTVYSTTYTLINQGTGDEFIDNIGIAMGNCNHYTTDPGGPVRCGIFAASSPNHTRVETGSGYYGVMELGGNLAEMVVNNFDIAGRSFTGLHGNGMLDSYGDADVDYWPGINGNNSESNANGAYGGSTGVTDYAGSGIRGGIFLTTVEQAMTSDRQNIVGPVLGVRADHYGFRGCRTAP